MPQCHQLPVQQGQNAVPLSPVSPGPSAVNVRQLAQADSPERCTPVQLHAIAHSRLPAVAAVAQPLAAYAAHLPALHFALAPVEALAVASSLASVALVPLRVLLHVQQGFVRFAQARPPDVPVRSATLPYHAPVEAPALVGRSEAIASVLRH